jgi:hypothetical protein
MIRCTGSPTGLLRTRDMHENFVLEFEFRFRAATGNAGLFVWSDALTAKGQPFSRSVEVQVMNGLEGPSYTSDGDIFAIHGATMTPVNPRPSNPSRSFPTARRMLPAGEWNHYRVVCDRGDITLAVNGQIVTTATNASPRKGYICLESEGTPIDFRNLILKPLPPADEPPTPAQIATPDEGFVSLFDGTFDAWKFEGVHEGHFKADDWVIDFDGKGDDLWTRRSYKDFVLIADWRWSGKPVDNNVPVILPDGSTPTGPDGKPATARVAEAGDSGIYLRGSSKSQVNIWCWPVGSGEVYGYRTDAAMPPEVRAGVTPRVNADAPIGQWNRFVITMKGERLSVVLNGKQVLENALLPGVAREGPIALQHHGGAIQFANLYIRELSE